jgi:hypothetical protein
LGSSWVSALDAPKASNSGDGVAGDDQEYDYADDEEVDMLKPIPKTPDVAPKLPDSFLSGIEDNTASLSDTLDSVFFSRLVWGLNSTSIGTRPSPHLIDAL